MSQGVPECSRCHRPLRTPESIRLGIGPVCARRRDGPALRTPAARKPVTAIVRPAADIEQIPGQTELELFFHQATLESL